MPNVGIARTQLVSKCLKISVAFLNIMYKKRRLLSFTRSDGNNCSKTPHHIYLFGKPEISYDSKAVGLPSQSLKFLIVQGSEEQCTPCEKGLTCDLVSHMEALHTTGITDAGLFYGCKVKNAPLKQPFSLRNHRKIYCCSFTCRSSTRYVKSLAYRMPHVSNRDNTTMKESRTSIGVLNT